MLIVDLQCHKEMHNGLRADVEQRRLMDAEITRRTIAFMERQAQGGKPFFAPSTTLADLLTPPLVADPFSTMRTSLRR